MRIALDAAGGVNAPKAQVEGAIRALAAAGGPSEIILVGNRDTILSSVSGSLDPRIIIEEANDAIPDGEAPLAGMHRLPRSTIVIAHELVKSGRADAVVSAGSTGAQLAAAVLKWGKLRWLVKPALGVTIPRPLKRSFLLDVGANPSVGPVHLAQFAAMGTVYVEEMLGIPHPRVALLSNGEEASKGTDAVKGAYQILRKTHILNFVGNIEGDEIFTDKADVVVTDGFTGNVFLKFAESLPGILGIDSSQLLRFLEPSQYGGVPILGVKGVSVVCHGRSNADAIAAALLEATRMVNLQLTTKMERLAARLRWQRFWLRPRIPDGLAGDSND